ncbi:MAG TPA: D-glucuronyl C5-epimerase family protein [Solirubrobacteraceae bacterium]|nr:D-glucuronyl C5-epimerase family protein [Solirubrobacteraceae bacterium]
MAWGRFALLLLVAALAGCGATPDPAPRPTPPPEVRTPDNLGPIKTATWQAAAVAEAERLARLRAAIRRAKASRTVPGALRYARLTRRLRRAEYHRLTAAYREARAAAKRLDGTRAYELGTVLATVESLAAQHALTPSRIRPALLVLRRNTQFWTHAAMPPSGHRTTFGPDPAVFQYYPGRGIQLQPLASWGRVNWLARTCLQKRRCPVRRLRRGVDGLLALGARRGGFLAWEHYFSWGGGTPPWISGMTQATAISALARASAALGVPRWRKAAHRALGAFSTPPPTGVDGGDHFLMYSFAPGLRIFNGELQAVSGIGELAALHPDVKAGRLFRRGERGARDMILAADTGAWSLYSYAGREATLSYHQLIEEFLDNMCERTGRRAYCDAARRFARYEREPTRIGLEPLQQLRARHTTTVRFSISKISTVRVRVYSERGVSLSHDFTLPYGRHSVGWTPPRRGRYRVRIEAQGPSGPVGVMAQTVDVKLPKPKKKKRRKDVLECQGKRVKEACELTRRPEPDSVER